jgi:hypothetical protein
VIEVRTGEQPVVIEARDGAIHTRMGSAEEPDAVITARPDLALALLLGRIDLATARTRGLKLDGNPKVLRRFRAVET